MPLSEGTASVLVGGINAVGTYFATKGVASEAKKTEKARRRLLELQTEEQRIKNQAAQMSLFGQDRVLPFAVSGPSLPSNAYDGGVRPAGNFPASAAGPAQLAGSRGLLVVGAVVAVAALAMMKARRV